MKRLIPFLLILTLVTGCAAANGISVLEAAGTDTTSTEETTIGTVSTTTQVAEDTDFERLTVSLPSDQLPTTNLVTLTVTESGIESSDPGISIQGSVITLESPGAYLLSGTLSDGQIIIDSDLDGTVQLFLENLDLTHQEGPAILVENADLTVITLVDGSVNRLSDGETHLTVDEDDLDGVIYSRDDLIFNGSGLLQINAMFENGIVANDSLAFVDGQYDITAVKNGIVAHDLIEFLSGTFTLLAGADGIKTTEETDAGQIIIENGVFDITSGDDAFQVATDLYLLGGDFNLLTGEGSSEVTFPTEGAMGGRGNFTKTFEGERTRPENSDSTRPTPPTVDGADAVSGSSEMPAMDESDDLDDTGDTNQKAIKAGGSITILGGTYVIDSQNDAVSAETGIHMLAGDFTIASGDDGFHSEQSLTIDGGQIVITKSYEGLEGNLITVNSGSISIISADDGLNVTGDDRTTLDLIINGGDLFIQAEGDGIDSNGALHINGGTLIVEGTTSSANSPLDADSSYVITGGDLSGYGSSGMAITPDSTDQGVISIILDTVITPAKVTLTDGTGEVVYSHTPGKSYQYLTVTSAQLLIGETYHVEIEGLTAFDVTLSDAIVTVSQNGTITTNPTGMGGGARR